MVNRKLTTLLIAALTLGQAGSMMALFAQAETTPPLFSPKGLLSTNQYSDGSQTLHVASVISRPEGSGVFDETRLDASIEPIQALEKSEVYTVSLGQSKLRTVIQVIAQSEDVSSLFVNTTEILRFHGVVNHESAYERAKKIAQSLHDRLITNPSLASSIRPVVRKNAAGAPEAAIVADNETLTVVSKENGKDASKLAFLYADRLRRSLGATPIRVYPLFVDHHIAQRTLCPPRYTGTGHTQIGMASWYGGFFHGRRAADGSRFNQHAMTAAHKTLPFGTIVKVSNSHTHKSCYVKITDRGPFVPGRIIDLSRGAANAIGMLGSGVAQVSLEIVRPRG